MPGVTLTAEGVRKIKEEIAHIRAVKIPRAEERLKQAKANDDSVETQDANAELDFYKKRIPLLEEWILSAVRQRNSSPVYLDRVEPEQIIEDKINLWREIIEKSRSDFKVFTEFETDVVPVSLLLANQCTKLESDIEKHEQELVELMEDAQLLNVKIG